MNKILGSENLRSKILPWTVDAADWAAATVVFLASTAFVAMTSAAAAALVSAVVNNSLAFAKISRRIFIKKMKEKKLV